MLLILLSTTIAHAESVVFSPVLELGVEQLFLHHDNSVTGADGTRPKAQWISYPWYTYATLGAFLKTQPLFLSGKVKTDLALIDDVNPPNLRAFHVSYTLKAELKLLPYTTIGYEHFCSHNMDYGNTPDLSAAYDLMYDRVYIRWTK